MAGYPASSAPVLPGDVALRPETAADRPFLAELYASTREEELRPLPWSDAQKRAFLGDQFELQWSFYRQHYGTADWLVVERAGQPIGRLYVHTSAREVQLMEISLVEHERGQGLGTALARSVLAYADALALPVTLHVEQFNPAFRLYERLGFQTVELRGVYQYMERRR